jgi:hypothetical protein
VCGPCCNNNSPHLHNGVCEKVCAEAALHEFAKDAVDGGHVGLWHVEDGKLALEAIGDVVLAAACTHRQTSQTASAVSA